MRSVERLMVALCDIVIWHAVFGLPFDICAPPDKCRDYTHSQEPPSILSEMSRQVHVPV